MARNFFHRRFKEAFDRNPPRKRRVVAHANHHCSNCGEPGHNMATCTDRRTVATEGVRVSGAHYKWNPEPLFRTVAGRDYNTLRSTKPVTF